VQVKKRSSAAIMVDGLGLEVGTGPRELAPGIFGLRLALPFALDHVNLWLLKDGPGWTLIDTGIANDATRAIWEGLLAASLDGRPITRLIATHFHPDHAGLAAWLVERTGAEYWTTRIEWLTARGMAHDVSAGFAEAGRRFDRRAGLEPALVEQRAARGNLYRTRAEPPPAAFARLAAGDAVVIDGERWEVLIGRGHAPEMICLDNSGRNLLLAADQVLPRISPNVSVWANEPEADPLADFLTSLEDFRDLPEDCLVLPSHGQAFRSLHGRIDELAGHHEERLERTLEACREPRTAVEVMPVLFERELDAHQLGFALGECLAHLNHVLAKGALDRELDGEGHYLYRAL
jgi:glyoxylase-like metal-dependent hydrolase (beta-lactamase superfamily II)